MNWKDINEIAIALEEKYPDKDNINLRFTDLYQWVCNLDGFKDEPQKSNERILEAIQMAWLKERGNE
jgi:FeS assembly protein IscX